METALTEAASWKGLASGEIDVILENWGHDGVKKTYIDDQKVAVEQGLTGNKGVIGWYVPPWMAEEYPDIMDWTNLNKYADLFDHRQVRRQGPAARRRPVVRDQRRRADQEPRSWTTRWCTRAARTR